jgi:tetratricopeptide (TPR) repeat protein
MNVFPALFSSLAFRSAGLRALGARRAVFSSVLAFLAGFAAFVAVRNSVYSGLQDVPLELGSQTGYFGAFLRMNLVQAALFLSVVYVPAIVSLSNAIAGDGLGMTISREEYRVQISALCPLWATLFFVAAPLQWLAPQFLVLGPVGISIGLLVLVLLLLVYTVWAIKELNHIPLAAACGVFALSWITLPVFYVLSSFLFTLPFFILLPLGILAYQRLQDYLAGRADEVSLQSRLHTLTLNEQDSDSQYQLGLIFFRRGSLEAARLHIGKAASIDGSDPDYAYHLGRICELQGDWNHALEHYENTYRLRPDYGHGDVFREVGKAYLHTGESEKAVEFLEFFLGARGSDPEGRFWLASALDKLGRREEMRVQLNTILEQARSHPRFFRKEKREWVFRSRTLLRSL